MKKNLVNKIASFFMAFLMAISVVFIAPDKSEAAKTPLGYVTFSIEKFTLGRGYLVEPVKVPFYEGENGASLIARVIEENGYELKYTGSIYDTSGTVEQGFYLSYIKDEDYEEVEIPQYILDRATEDIYGREDPDWLGEFDYTSMSGWMYSVNNVFPNFGASMYKPKDGDVVRVQFTVWGYGADLGDNSEWGEAAYLEYADKTKLTQKIAEINSASNSAKLLADKKICEEYEKALELLKDMTSTQGDIDKAYNSLKSEIDRFYKEEAAAVKSNKVKNFAFKSSTSSSVTLTWDKVKNADGYKIYRYDLATKKYKLIKTIKDINTLTYTNTKRTSATVYSYRIRAYKDVNGEIVNSAASSTVKTVTKPLTPKLTLSTSSKSVKINISNCSSKATGYQIRMAESKSGTYKIIKTTSSKAYTKTGLTKGKTYYFKARAYRTVDGKKVYGSYSTIVSIKVK